MRTLGNLTLLVSSLSGVPGRKTLLYVTDGLPLTPAEELNEAFNQICGGGAAHSGVDLGDVPLFDRSGSVEQAYLAPISPLDAEMNGIAKSLDQLAARANANRVTFYTLQATGAAALAASSAGSGPDEGIMRLRTLAALLYGVEDNPLEVQLEAQAPVAGDKGLYTVPLRLRIPLFKLGILNQEATFTGSLRLFIATRASGGAISPVRQVAVPIRIPRAEVLRAMGQFFLYSLTLQLAPGEQRVAVAVRDELAAATSYLARPVSVPGAPGGAGVAAATDH
jgi:hypothetical protein